MRAGKKSSRRAPRPRFFLYAAIAFILGSSSVFLASSLRFDSAGATVIASAILTALSLYSLRRISSFPQWRTCEVLSFGIFAIVFNLGLLLGGHVQFTPGEGYLGSLEQNVIRAYTPFDVLSFFGALPSLFVLFLALIRA